MPFESKFTKEEIVDAAFDIAKEKGFSAITARTVAKSIKSSVAPIYFNFENIEELRRAVVKKVFAISKEILDEQKSTDRYENMGKAGFVFADRYPVFFRELVLNPNPYLASYETIQSQMIEGLKNDSLVSKLSLDEIKILIFKMRALQIGVQTMIANDQLPSFMTKEEAINVFFDTGYELAQSQIYKKK